MRMLMAGLLMFFIYQTFFNHPKSNQAPPRTAPALAQAFAGIDPALVPGIPALNVTTGNAEIKKLQANVTTNDSDALAQWSRLRMALIQQYVLGTLVPSTRKSGFLGFGSDVTYYAPYDDIIKANVGDAVEAQAIYQEGDLLWRQSLQKPDLANSSVTVLESLIHKGRGNAAFRDFQIYVPKIVDPAKVPLSGIPQGGFTPVAVANLHGTLPAPNPQGILDRVNQFYSTSVLYKVFDSVVRALGANPTFSYGLAVLLFALFTRTVMQPIYKKQYESMKGMAAIAPEMKKIQEKYKGKSEQTAQMQQMKEIQDLQRRHGVNPMLGCGLALIQMPIFFLFVYPMIQHYEPKMELALASFLWIPALARPDIPLLVLYGASMFFSFRLSSTPPTDDMQRQQQMLMSFAFPFIFPIFIASYPAAFTMYWMTYNAIGTFYQWRMMKTADPSKNFWLTLKGDGIIPRNPTADAVPARPVESNGTAKNGSAKAKSVKIQTKTPSLNGTIDAAAKAVENGINGSNGIHHSAPDGIVLEPSADEIEKRKKKKK
ncbi:membrane protein insertase YidC 2 [Abditibacteriota bacterium]|nr:membrane protein insertase YidC 2 [Abditibacteriota bacterium]